MSVISLMKQCSFCGMLSDDLQSLSRYGGTLACKSCRDAINKTIMIKPKTIESIVRIKKHPSSGAVCSFKSNSILLFLTVRVN